MFVELNVMGIVFNLVKNREDKVSRNWLTTSATRERPREEYMRKFKRLKCQRHFVKL